MNFTRASLPCPVIEVYGLTEMGGILSATLLGEMEPGRTGTRHLGLQVKLIDVPEMNLFVKRDGLGEICVTGEACTKGYYRDEANTNELFEPGGFLSTGDIGTWTKEGAVKLIDRRKSFFKLVQREYVTPNKVEDLYSSSVLANNVFVDGDSRETFVVAAVEPNFTELRKFLISQAVIG
ncbi:Long-chain-fatty-acid--CoA ligase 5 [Fasciola gigantica]|uniref:long-chain-fatty-acid--CoA ligase n=1 Tax=Fasciola gigantica TaxID=46835 RepID=A0A504ZBA0_FASGI|nr:Long-chain-fatty-acid--CoA ligase 5 [Fasciola gigantica]